MIKTSDVIRIQQDVKEEIEQFQTQWAKEKGEWLSYNQALKKMLDNGKLK